MGRLTGKVAVITGATSGIGLMTAKSFLEEGAKVVITGRNQDKLDALQTTLSGHFLLVKADAASVRESKQLVKATVEHFGKIDILFLNAGIFKTAPLGGLSEKFIDDIFDINVKGPLMTANEAVAQMNEGGTIIFNTSVSNVKGMPGVSVYGASKAALRSVVRGLAVELAPRNIRVNAVSPGPIETPLWGKTNLTEEEINGFAAGVSQQVPLGRFGKAEEIAKTVVFLASDESSYITATEVPVDGGMAQV